MTQVVKKYLDKGDAAGLWAVVMIKDETMSFEGLVINEAPHGVYLCIGGDGDRLSLFPWSEIARIVYKSLS